MRFLKSQNQIYFINNFKIYLVEPTQPIDSYTVKDDKVFNESIECILTEISNTYITYGVIYDNLNDEDFKDSIIINGKKISITTNYMYYICEDELHLSLEFKKKISDNETILKVYEELIKKQNDYKIIILQNGYGFFNINNKWFQIITKLSQIVFTDTKDFKFLNNKLFYKMDECNLLDLTYQQWNKLIDRSLSIYYKKMMMPPLKRRYYKTYHSGIRVYVNHTWYISIEIDEYLDFNILLTAHDDMIDVIRNEYELRQKAELMPKYNPPSEKLVKPELKQMPKIPYFIEMNFDDLLIRKYITTTAKAPLPDKN